MCEDLHTNLVHLSCTITVSATDMIEEIGMLKGIMRIEQDRLKPWHMDELRKAIKKVSRAIAAYDYFVEVGIDKPSNDEWRSAMGPSS